MLDPEPEARLIVQLPGRGAAGAAGAGGAAAAPGRAPPLRAHACAPARGRHGLPLLRAHRLRRSLPPLCLAVPPTVRMTPPWEAHYEGSPASAMYACTV